MRRLFFLGFFGVSCYGINVIPATNLPPRTQGEVFTGTEDTNLVIQVSQLLTNDLDPEGDTELTLEIVANSATNGTATLNGGEIAFAPTPNFTGVASFSYIVLDETSVPSAPTTVNIDFANVNDIPVAIDPGEISTNEDTSTTIILRATDIDSGTLTFEILNNPPLTLGALTLLQEQATSSTFLYVPTSNVSGTDSFRFQAVDGDGFRSQIIDVDINILAINDAPAAVEDNNITVTRGGTVLIDVLANDGDLESQTSALTPEIVIPPLSGSAAVVGDQILFSATDETLGPVIFFYSANDGSATSTPARVTVNIDRTCGDGFVDSADGEQCDEQNGSGCEADCTFTCAGSLAPNATATNASSCYATFRAGNLNFAADWNVAASFCSQNGGQLVVVNDAAENTLLRGPELSLSTDLIWIGASDQLVEENLADNIRGDDFLWVDNTFIGNGFSDFATGQPNNGNGIEDCLYMLESGEWDDTDCTNPAAGGVSLVNSMICEFPLP